MRSKPFSTIRFLSNITSKKGTNSKVSFVTILTPQTVWSKESLEMYALTEATICGRWRSIKKCSTKRPFRMIEPWRIEIRGPCSISSHRLRQMGLNFQATNSFKVSIKIYILYKKRGSRAKIYLFIANRAVLIFSLFFFNLLSPLQP